MQKFRDYFKPKERRIVFGILFASLFSLFLVLLLVPEKAEADLSEVFDTASETTAAERIQYLTLKDRRRSSGGKETAEQFEIVDSRFQYVQDYSWEDMYVILLEITRTSPCLKGNTPVFSLFRLPGFETPFLCIGYRGQDAENTELHLYIVDRGYIYELLDFSEDLYYLPDTGFLCLLSDNTVYAYAPHVLLRSSLNETPGDPLRIAFLSLENKKITSELLSDYIVDLSREDSQ